jgi:hypothetical protein
VGEETICYKITYKIISYEYIIIAGNKLTGEIELAEGEVSLYKYFTEKGVRVVYIS